MGTSLNAVAKSPALQTNTEKTQPDKLQKEVSNEAVDFTFPVNTIKMSAYVNNATETRDGKNSSIIKITDVNSNHIIDKGDKIEYYDSKNIKKESDVADLKDVGITQISATNISLKDGSTIKASKQNLFKTASLLKFKENNISDRTQDLKINSKMPPEKIYSATIRLTNDANRILHKDKILLADIYNSLSLEELKKYTDKINDSYNKDKTQMIIKYKKEIPKTLNLAGFMKYIVEPYSKELLQKTTNTDLDNPEWGNGLCAGYYTEHDNDNMDK